MSKLSILFLVIFFLAVPLNAHAGKVASFPLYDCTLALEKVSRLSEGLESESDHAVQNPVMELADLALVRAPILLTSLHRTVALESFTKGTSMVAYPDNIKSVYERMPQAQKDAVLQETYERLISNYKPFFGKTNIASFSDQDHELLTKLVTATGSTESEALQSAQVLKLIDENPTLRMAFSTLLEITLGFLKTENPSSRQRFEIYTALKNEPSNRIPSKSVKVEGYDKGLVVLKRSYGKDASLVEKINIVDLTTKEYPILVQKPYSWAFEQVLKRAGVGAKDFSKIVKSYSDPELDALSASIWDILAFKYKAHVPRSEEAWDNLTVKNLESAQASGTDIGQDVGGFLQTGLIVRALDENSATKQVVLKMIRESLLLTVNAERIDAERKKDSKYNAAAVTTAVGSVLAGFGVTGASVAYAGPHTFAPAIIAGALGAVWGVGSLVGGEEVYDAAKEKFRKWGGYWAQRKRNKAAKLAAKVPKKFTPSGQADDGE